MRSMTLIFVAMFSASAFGQERFACKFFFDAHTTTNTALTVVENSPRLPTISERIAERERFSGLLEQTPPQVVDVAKKFADALLERTPVLEKLSEQRGEFPATPSALRESFEQSVGRVQEVTPESVARVYGLKEKDAVDVLDTIRLMDEAPIASQFALTIMNQSFGKQLVAQSKFKQALADARAKGKPLRIFQIYRDRTKTLQFFRSDAGFMTIMAGMAGSTLGPLYIGAKVAPFFAADLPTAVGIAYGVEFAGGFALALKDVRVSFKPKIAREQYLARSNLKKGKAEFQRALRLATPLLSKHKFDYELEQIWKDWRSDALAETLLSPRERESVTSVSRRLMATSFLLTTFGRLELGNGQSYRQGRKALTSSSEVVRSAYQTEVIKGLERKLEQLDLIRFELEQLKVDVDAGLHDKQWVSEDHALLNRLIESHRDREANAQEINNELQDSVNRRAIHMQSEVVIGMLTQIAEIQSALLTAQKEAFEANAGMSWIESRITKRWWQF